MPHLDEPLTPIYVDVPQALPVASPPSIAWRAVPIVSVKRKPWPVRLVLGFLSVVEWCVGVLSLFVGLAVLASIPILQFLCLGYLLELTGRVARTGRLRDGFIGVRKAARLGSIFGGAWLLFWPVRFLSDYAQSATILDPGSRMANGWWLGSVVFATLTGLHILQAIAAGGKLRHFLWPFHFVTIGLRVLNGGYYQKCRDSVCDFVLSLRLPHYAQLGLKGFLVGLAWLFLPATLLAVGRQPFQGAPMFMLLGAILLGWVVLYLPFLQARLAMTNRWREGFRLLAVRRDFRRAPWAYLVAFTLTLLLALPLYFFKVEVIPREAVWLPGLIFIAFIAPARLITGWAVARAMRRETPRHWVFRWSARLLFPAVSLVYVGWVFLTPYTTWNGVAAFYEQHAFLLPIPLM
ncbi:MAG: hypothetical protein ACRC8S_09770 [Fimbriiglobus sp.]